MRVYVHPTTGEPTHGLIESNDEWTVTMSLGFLFYPTDDARFESYNITWIDEPVHWRPASRMETERLMDQLYQDDPDLHSQLLSFGVSGS